MDTLKKVFVYLLFGGVFGCWIQRIVSGLGGLLGWLCPITHKKKKKVSHWERRARAMTKVRTFRRQALAVALVLRCWCRLHNKPPPLVSLSSKLEPVRWKLKMKNVADWTL